jgi:hypothetical protein
MSNTKGLRRRTRSKFQRGFRQSGAVRNIMFDINFMLLFFINNKKMTRYLYLM